MPSKSQANTYAAVTNYLKALDAAKSDDAETVAKQMKAGPLFDLGRPAVVRQTGRVVYDLRIFIWKKPGTVEISMGLFKPVRTVTTEEALGPTCPGTASCHELRVALIACRGKLRRARYQSQMILGRVGQFMVVAADEADQSSGRFKTSGLPRASLLATTKQSLNRNASCLMPLERHQRAHRHVELTDLCRRRRARAGR